ncbi:actinorhodin polyketide synthase acyl carrier protein [Actinomadura sp. NBRC 104425]|uniref:acyl carrier protein n=1 Tax=Actinomadura sp. NBRC 104425 TaxID=3032204 RepID=UPI0024A1D474|nr:acyl carrier protein [Actinomadura sp. NBRC 104425]GLZ15457.1 actinorhodin polyketide synthase acyl carrier protein [Actinomadura sp. NBRC 104425]
MATAITIDDLGRILREAAGIELGPDAADQPFADLGYDSLALLETGSRIEREYGVRLEDDTLTEAETPTALLDVVNRHLAAAGAA